MANTDRPNGFTPVSTLFGGPYTGNSMKRFSVTNNLFMGDLVNLASDSTPSGSGAYGNVDRCAAVTDTILGVVVGWEPNPNAQENLYHTASATYAVFIAPIQDVILEAQSDDATMVQADVGLNIDATFTAGSVVTGLSNMEINGNTAAVTAGLQFKIVGMVDRADNDITDAIANQRFLLTVNQSGWADQTAGV